MQCTVVARRVGACPLGQPPEGGAATPAGRILVIEDHPRIAALLTAVLLAAGYPVTVLDSALGAHATVQCLRPAAIVLDLGLPYRSGAALLADLKADPTTAAVPVLVVSAYTDTLPSERAALAAAVIRKPFSPAALVAALQAAM